MSKKHTILFISDHQIGTSGVGVQARMLIEGLLKTGKYSFKCLGGAMRHENYETIAISPDFIIKPVDGFGTKESLRQILITQRPDAVVIFTDPRQFVWLWEMEDEIKQICPIAYWHVWDNEPYPTFNDVWYESTELINCLSYKTYEMLKEHHPNKVNYIPHAFPKELYKPLPENIVKQIRDQHFGDRSNWQIGLWVNRNATRKVPGDVLECFKQHLDNLEKQYGHRNSLLIMHTDPLDIEGPNLLAVTEMLGITENVWFSTQKLEFADMNVLHNITDYVVNVSKAEGFGLSTLISMLVGKPIIALKTGGMIRQVIDWRDGSQNGFAIEPGVRALVGSQMVPFIYDDHLNKDQLVKAFMDHHNLSQEEKRILSEKVREYALFEFDYEKMVKDWDQSLEKCILDFKAGKNKQWSIEKINLTPGVTKKAKQQKSVAQSQNMEALRKMVSQPVVADKQKINIDELMASGMARKPKVK